MRNLNQHTWLCLLLSLAVATEIWTQDSGSSPVVAMESGGTTYRLVHTGEGVALDYFGPTTGTDTLFIGTPTPELTGLVGGTSVGGAALELLDIKTSSPGSGVNEWLLRYRHRSLPLEIEARYRAMGPTGVLTRRLRYVNTGIHPMPVEDAPLLTLDLPVGAFTMRTLYGGWGQEKQLEVEPLPASGKRRFDQSNGRSSNFYNPWISLRNERTGVEYVAELAWSGNWWIEVERVPGGAASRPDDRPVRLRMGIRNDFGGDLVLAPGEAFTFPEVAFTAITGDFDDATNRMHRYQRNYVFPDASPNRPLPVHFNTWYPLGPDVDITNTKRAADAAAAIGAETFVVDSGWYVEKDWSRELGDYRVNRRKFPNGLEELATYVRSKGMKFGLWVEIENAGIDSRLLQEHPEWFLPYEGRPHLSGQRAQLDFSNPDVRKWATGTVGRLVRDYGLEWIKIDYNIDVGDRFDPTGKDRGGDRLYRHILSYYDWLDGLRATFPTLVVENCSSGGLRFDSGIMAHTHTTWVSDVVNPVPSLSLRYGCTVQFSPEVCNHWIVGDHDSGVLDPNRPSSWWDFMFRVAMNGQFGISSRLWEWRTEQLEHARDAVTTYKRIRDVIAGADVYHLTPPPDRNDPKGWMSMQYVNEANGRSVLFAYRLSEGTPEQIYRLRGLDVGRRYRVSENGSSPHLVTGAELAEGFTVRLPDAWQSVVVEIEPN